MHRQVKQKILLSIFFFNFVNFSCFEILESFSCFEILESITLFKAINILKNTLNMYKISRIAKSAIVNRNECKYLNAKLTKNPADALATWKS